jgi:hypothetical protein
MSLLRTIFELLRTEASEEPLQKMTGHLPKRGEMPVPFPVLDHHFLYDKEAPRSVDALIRRVPLSSLYATQETIDPDNVRNFLVDPTIGGYPLVTPHEQGYAIVDGHHRLSAALMRGEMSALVHVTEDAPAMAAGNGQIAGLGVGPQGEPGIDLRTRRKKLDQATVAAGLSVTEAASDTFAGGDVMDVDLSRVMNAMNPKKPWERFSKYVGIDEVGENIRSHARTRANWKKDIILRDAKTGIMTYLRRRQK